MSGLSEEQVVELKAEMVAKRNNAYAEYNRCVGAIKVLDLLDGSVEIIEKDAQEAKIPDGKTP